MPPISKEIQDSFETSCRVLAEMIRLLDQVIASALGHESGVPSVEQGLAARPRTQRVLPAMLQAMGSSTNTLVRLSDGPGLQSRDCFSICRSIVESGVNVCFVLAQGEDVASRALRHSEQKAFRDLVRESEVGGQTLRLAALGGEEVDLPVELKKAMAEFTARSGREKGWIDLSINARCARVGEVLGEDVLTPLHWARFAIYRHSSEILHGTFFGAAFFMGLTSPSGPPKTPQELATNIAHQHLMVLVAAALSLSAVISAIHVAFGTPQLLADAQKGVSEMRNASWLGGSGEDPNREA